MGEDTLIEWCDYTFNAWIGCEKVSAACKNCYAEVDTFARRMRANGVELWGSSQQNAHRYVTSDEYWKKPARWNREAQKAGEKRIVFCNSLSDIFDDYVPSEEAKRLMPYPHTLRGGERIDDDPLRKTRARLWKVMYETPNLYWLLLTKRPQNADRFALQAYSDAWLAGDREGPDGWWLPNIWLGTTAEDQEHVDERMFALIGIHPRPKILFASMEPLLEKVDARPYLRGNVRALSASIGHHGLTGHPCYGSGQSAQCDDKACGAAWEDGEGIDWVIVGGESGNHSRALDVENVRDVVQQCAEAEVPCFVKQLGKKIVNPHGESALAELRWKHKKGGDMKEWPVDLRIRQFPVARGATP